MSLGANPKGAQWSTPLSRVMFAGAFLLALFLPPLLGGISLAASVIQNPARALECY